MMSLLRKTILTLVLVMTQACGSGSGGGTFADANQLAIDSTNNRLFVIQPRGEIFTYVASTLEAIAGDQPLISESNNETINALLPDLISKIDVYTNGSTSRLFIMGAVYNSQGELALNRIVVLDFNGTTFSQPSFSPIDLSDGDATTTDIDNSFPDLKVDQTSGRVLITDATTGQLQMLDADDGSVIVGTPLNLGGAPQKIAINNGRAFICNSTATEAQQLVSVVNIQALTVTNIDLNIPCTLIGVARNSNGTVLLAKHANDQQVLIHTVDTTTFASSAGIPAGSSDLSNGSLLSGQGISSSILSIAGTNDGDTIYFYLTETDGNVQVVTIPSTLASFTLETISSAALSISKSQVLVDTSGNGQTAFFAAESGALVSLSVGASEVDVTN